EGEHFEATGHLDRHYDVVAADRGGEHFGAGRQGGSDVGEGGRRRASPELKNAVADDAEHGRDRDEGGGGGDRHQAAHFGDHARGVGIERFFVVGHKLNHGDNRDSQDRRRGSRSTARPRAGGADPFVIALV